MTDFDWFNDFVEEDKKSEPTDPEVEAAVKAAQEAQDLANKESAALLGMQDNTAAYEDELFELARQQREIARKVKAVQAEKDKQAAIIFEQRRAAKKAQAEADAKQRAVSVAVENMQQRIRYAETQEEFERIAADMPWRKGIEINGEIRRDLPHQWEAIKFLGSAKRALLGDEMGLGKSLSAIAALDMVRSTRALVITPAEVASNFVREVQRWAPHRRVVSLQGKTKNERDLILQMAGSFEPVVIVVNYEAWRRDNNLLAKFQEFGFDTVLVDEAHNLKDTSSDAFRGVRSIVLANNMCPYDQTVFITNKCPQCGYARGSSPHLPVATEHTRYFCTRSAKNLFLMTGTPILNAPEDLYSQLSLIDPLNFPRKNEFLVQYCILNAATGKYGFRAGGQESLVKRLSGKYLARTQDSAGVTVPPQDVRLHELSFTPDEYLEQQDIIKQLTEHAQIVVDENNNTGAIEMIALITRQRQANVWPGGIQIWRHPMWMGIEDKTKPKELIFTAEHIQESIKIDKAIEIFEEEFASGHRFALFSQFKTALAEVEKRLIAKGYRVARFDGDTSSAEKERIKKNFDGTLSEDSIYDIVLCNYKTGGVGLTLTAATQMIILDEEWNPGKRDQAYKRIARMGQTQNTTVHLLRVKDTVDEWLAKLIETKENMIDGFDDAASEMQRIFAEKLMEGKK